MSKHIYTYWPFTDWLTLTQSLFFFYDSFVTRLSTADVWIKISSQQSTVKVMILILLTKLMRKPFNRKQLWHQQFNTDSLFITLIYSCSCFGFYSELIKVNQSQRRRLGSGAAGYTNTDGGETLQLFTVIRVINQEVILQWSVLVRSQYAVIILNHCP